MSYHLSILKTLDWDSITDTKLSGGFVCVAVYAAWCLFARGAQLPPGPRGLPLVGNLFDLTTSFEWETFGAWADKWGPLVSASTMGTHIIVVNTYAKAVALIDKKAVMYSTRPHIPMAVNLMGWGAASHFQPYGETFKEHRKMLHEELASGKGIKEWLSVVEERARKLVELCLKSPGADELAALAYQHPASTLLKILYGYTAKDADDELVNKAQAAMRGFNLGCAPAAKYAVNVIPLLRYVPSWFPGAQFQRNAKIWKGALMDMVLSPFTFTKSAIANGTQDESVILNRINNGISPEDEATMVAVAASWLGAGSQNVAILVHYFFYILATYPEVQKRAQAEIDSVVGQGRLPTWEDRHQLPYLNALIKEMLRLHPVVPTGIPHATSEDDVHDGYFIPKGSIIMFNIWKMGRDPELYVSPMKFNPDRFLGATPEQDPGAYVWGFGRRVCPGRMLAESIVVTTLGTCLATMNVEAVKNSVGPVFRPSGEPMNRLAPFECDITPRWGQAVTGELLQRV